ncbi:MAG TPA: nucleotidyltransferase [Paenibacillus sp.]|uniref:nucleotidyltransferase n=1 Tax=Paenibacillus sp. TaxID=58172 RepID=UPI002CC27064|nr:nucleotidyltransferase [Paenibacillus sp.]HUC91017.1 nucleotidyltransferase [Paenibacillus sp.]
MRTVGLIVEYNPFHNGHLYHLRRSVAVTQADAVVAVMSGNFLQRGEPALAGKRARTEMAMRGGCDLVIELPVSYATHAAEWFAYGAVSMLDATGVVDALCFGSESGEIAALRRIAAVAAHEPAVLKERLAERLRRGQSYPAAYSAALRDCFEAAGDAEAAAFPLEQPNNTLGLHYLIALERLGSPIEPFTIRREKAGYNERTVTDGAIASATALRKLLNEQRHPETIAPYVPASTLAILEREWRAGRAPLGWHAFAGKLFHMLVRADAVELASCRDVGEGLEHRIKQCLPLLPSLDFEQLVDAVKTKRYTRTRLQRAFLSILLGLRKEEALPALLEDGLRYIRVLGFNDKGQALLKRMRDCAKLPVLLGAARPPARFRQLELDAAASAVYALGYDAPAPRDIASDFYEPPVRI